MAQTGQRQCLACPDDLACFLVDDLGAASPLEEGLDLDARSAWIHNRPNGTGDEAAGLCHNACPERMSDD
jgi:hypothetical protein